MLLIQQPISRRASILLGLTSVGCLLGGYTWLAHARQESKRAALRELVRPLEEDVRRLEMELDAQPTDGGGTAGSVTSRRDALHQRLTALQHDAATATDRSVPTWTSLYRDGVLRVLQPQGLRRNEYWLRDDVWATTERLLTGLGVSVLVSVVLGVLMGAYTPIEAFFLPPLSFLAKIPPTAMLAVFFVLVGTRFPMYVTLIVFGTLPTLAQTAYQAARKDVAPSLIFKAYTLGASQAELIWNVVYKQVLPRLIDAVRLQVGPAMILLVAAEWMVASEGFGYRLRLFYQRTDMTVVYVYVLILGFGGWCVDMALTWFRRWLCPWFGS